jgi:glycolate oxidase FAD binding subunit
MERDLTATLTEQIIDAASHGGALRIEGGGSKHFYGRRTEGEPLVVAEHRGIVSYEPTELVLTARAGTPLADIEAALAEHDQMLAFEPPHFEGGATLGGAVASGLSGPRRAFTGAVRDMVLGVRLINGRGEVLRFGGEVMKNVAGYDVSRLMAGALGTLGVLTEVSVKVLPRPESEQSVALESDMTGQFRRVETWRREGIPVSAVADDGERMAVRLSGSAGSVQAAARHIGGQPLEDGDAFWRQLRDHRLPLFAESIELPLWRIALPPGSTLPDFDGDARVLEWAGQQLWIRTQRPADELRRAADERGGHATLFRGGDRDGEVFHPLSPGIAHFHRRLKHAFDPQGILNPGRLYPSL